MPLLVNLRRLEDRNVRLEGELPVEELDLELRDDMICAEKPLRYDIEAQMLEQALLLYGRLQLSLKCRCVRCLKPFECKLELKHWTLHLPLEGEDKVPVSGDFVDLTPHVREDILLEFPQHPLCKTDCGGLPNKSVGKPKKAKKESSAWAELDKLKLN